MVDWLKWLTIAGVGAGLAAIVGVEMAGESGGARRPTVMVNGVVTPASVIEPLRTFYKGQEAEYQRVLSGLSARAANDTIGGGVHPDHDLYDASFITRLGELVKEHIEKSRRGQGVL